MNFVEISLPKSFFDPPHSFDVARSLRFGVVWRDEKVGFRCRDLAGVINMYELANHAELERQQLQCDSICSYTE